MCLLIAEQRVQHFFTCLSVVDKKLLGSAYLAGFRF